MDIQVENKLIIRDIRKDFPILSTKNKGKDLVYLDNAASTQKPNCVIYTTDDYYKTINSNVHRGIYELSERATMAYENSRKRVAKFLNANSENEIIFTKGTTESINLVASSFGRSQLKPGDEILISHMEHHANIVPWQMLAEEKGLKINVIPITESGELKLEEFKNLLNEKTKLVSIVHVSNTLGTINPVEEIIEEAHSVGAKVLLDGAQSIQHIDVDVQKLDCDFFAFSGHKLYGPTGIGILYGKEEILELIPPYQGGGEMIKKVTFEKTSYNDLPFKFEAGTPNIVGGIGLKAAIDYVDELGKDRIAAYEDELLAYATDKLSSIDGLKIYGTAKNKTSSLSFLIKGIHPTDIAQMCDTYGIAVRTGHHCTQPLMDFFNIPGTCRASFSFYNTIEEIDFLYESLIKIKNLLG